MTEQGTAPAREINGTVFQARSFREHEQVVFCHDEATGLKAIIGIHSTVLGPALGGTRMWNYQNENDAINDVLRLSRGMTYKASISGLDLGGGKAVIIGDSRKEKTDELMMAFGTYVDSLGGRYITAEDVGMTTHDMEMVKRSTDYVTGISEENGGSGNPSPVTAYGVFMGIRAAARYRWGSDNLDGRKVMVQGIGHVGEALVEHLTKAGAQVTVNDIHRDRVLDVAKKYGTEMYLGEAIFDQEMDIYAPCALGATVNSESIAKMKCGIIAGAANNQLADDETHGAKLKDAGIDYAPDFLINAGGLINVNSEIAGYGRDEIMRKTEEIYDTTLRIFTESEQNEITTQAAALRIARSRIREAGIN